MVSTFTPNIHAELQGTGDNSGTWGAELNTAVFTIIDTVFGGAQTISLASTDVTLNTAQTQNNFIKLIGVLTANVNLIFPTIGRTFYIQNSTTGAFTVTVKIGAGATAVSTQGQGQFFILDATNVFLATPLQVLDGIWRILNSTDQTKQLAFDLSGIAAATLRTVALPNASGTMMLTGAGQTTIASAATTTLASSPTIDIIISGTTTITSFGSATAGTYRRGYFSGALTLTNNGTSLILPSGKNIPTAAGDSFLAVSLGSTNWKVLAYVPINGQALSAIGLGQTWQDVSGSRVVGTFYQNTSAVPIQASMGIRQDSGTLFYEVSPNGSTGIVAVGNFNAGGGTYAPFSVIVPPGTYYRVRTTGGATILSWAELK